MRPAPPLLDVIIPFSNPMRWQNRIKNFKACVESLMRQPGIRLTVVMQTHGNHCHDIDLPPGVHVVDIHGSSLLWNKENTIELGVHRLPRDWQYVCWLDGDIIFRDHNWATETVHYLGHHPIIQPWSTAINLGPHGEIIKVNHSFGWCWNHEPACCTKMGKGGYKLAHPGFAWACTRWAWDHLGGLLDHCILGAADHHMALALIGKADYSIKTGVTRNYSDPILQWQERAAIFGKRVYYRPGTIEHLWHGNFSGKHGRGYVERWGILLKHKYDPATDVRYNGHGVLELAGNKPELARDIHRYFAERNEDMNVLLD
jgi:hypothetical protein